MTCDPRLELDDLSAQSARARINQRVSLYHVAIGGERGFCNSPHREPVVAVSRGLLGGTIPCPRSEVLLVGGAPTFPKRGDETGGGNGISQPRYHRQRVPYRPVRERHHSKAEQARQEGQYP